MMLDNGFLLWYIHAMNENSNQLLFSKQSKKFAYEPLSHQVGKPTSRGVKILRYSLTKEKFEARQVS